MNDRERLLHELNDGRRHLLSAMADLEEEQGDSRRARGWRWLAAHDRWPSFCERYDESDGFEGEELFTAGWEWWREKRDARFSCSLPGPLMDAVRRLAATPKGLTCRFESPSQALGCAATCAGKLIDADLLEQSPRSE